MESSCLSNTRPLNLRPLIAAQVRRPRLATPEHYLITSVILRSCSSIADSWWPRTWLATSRDPGAFKMRVVARGRLPSILDREVRVLSGINVAR